MTRPSWETWRDKDGLLRAEGPAGEVAWIDDGRVRIDGQDQPTGVPVDLVELLIADARARGILAGEKIGPESFAAEKSEADTVSPVPAQVPEP